MDVDPRTLIAIGQSCDQAFFHRCAVAVRDHEGFSANIVPLDCTLLGERVRLRERDNDSFAP
ncbi:MAG TPA: hypothetical protein VGD45_10675 [Steroidobacter sp.]